MEKSKKERIHVNTHTKIKADMEIDLSSVEKTDSEEIFSICTGLNCSTKTNVIAEVYFDICEIKDGFLDSDFDICIGTGVKYSCNISSHCSTAKDLEGFGLTFTINNDLIKVRKTDIIAYDNLNRKIELDDFHCDNDDWNDVPDDEKPYDEIELFAQWKAKYCHRYGFKLHAFPLIYKQHCKSVTSRLFLNFDSRCT